MKYRKKPVVIEAYQTDKELDIETLEGVMHASVGDYIITGVNGEQYPCKPDIFRKTYELADKPTIEPPQWISAKDRLPESGTHVLVCCEIHGGLGGRHHYVCDAFHTDAKSIPCSYADDIDSEYDEETDEYYFPVGWWEVIKNWDDYSCVAIEDFVTHWMPLPEPPKEE